MTTTKHLLFCFLLALISRCQGQSSAGVPLLGTPPGDAFESFTFDHVDTSNGNVVLDIPLYALPQLGTLKLAFSIKANSTGWMEETTCDYEDYGNYCNAWYGRALPGGWLTQNQPFHPSVALDQDIVPQTIVEEWLPPTSGPLSSSGQYDLRLYVQEPDYTLHSLAFDGNDQTRLRARSIDGSGYMAYYPAAITTPWTSQFPIPTIYDKLGVARSWSYSQNSSGLEIETETITDPNHNAIARTTSFPQGSTPSGSFIDSLGRTVPDPTNVIITTSTHGCPLATTGATNQPLIGSYRWVPPAPAGSPTGYGFLFCYSAIAVNTNFFNLSNSNNGCSEFGWACAEFTGIETVLSSIVLPNGTSWQFVYDSADFGNPTSYGYGRTDETFIADWRFYLVSICIAASL